MNNDFFADAAAHWDANPRRVELAKSVGNAILQQVKPPATADVLDYGCGTGLVGLFLQPHVHSVTGADSSPAMLQVLQEKIRNGKLQNMRVQKLDLQQDAVPEPSYHLIVANMVMHHIDRTGPILKAFHQMLLPGGFAAISDLDTEPGTFHGPEAAASVFHHGFARDWFLDAMRQAGFVDLAASTADVMHKPIADGTICGFPIFLISGRRA